MNALFEPPTVYSTSVERWRNYLPYLGPLAELAPS